MKSQVVLSALATMISIPAFAQDDSSVIPRAMNNLSHEYAICSAYYGIVSVALENSDDPATAARYMEAANRSLENAIMVGNEAGLLTSVHDARLEIAINDMMGQIAGNTSNISILLVAYNDSCLEAMNNIAGRMDHYIGVEFEREFGYPMPRE